MDVLLICSRATSKLFVRPQLIRHTPTLKVPNHNPHYSAKSES